MQTHYIASVEGVTAEQSPSNLTLASRPINIASVRATSLHTSGLRAASSRRGTDAQKEIKSAVTASGTETRTSVNQLSCSSSSVSMPSSTLLSYTNSQEPGEDSQLNAYATVDKLVNLNASLMWQKAESSIAAEQSCMKGLQSNKGIQSLARNADMKSLQDKLGTYDWIDSQPDENGGFGQVSPIFQGQQKQLEAGMLTKSRKVRQVMVSDLAGENDTSKAPVMAKKASSVKQQNTGSSLHEPVSVRAAEGNHAREGSTSFEHQPFRSLQRLGGSNVSNKLHDTDASCDKGEVEMIDIGANTQVALEAMDIMRCGILLNHGSALHNAKATSALFAIGNDTQTAIDAMDIMLNNKSGPHNEKVVSSSFDIGHDTQTAIDAIDLMRQGIETNIVLPKINAASSLFDIGEDTQTAIDAIDIMRHGIGIGFSKVERQEEAEQCLRIQNSRSDVRKHASEDKLDAKSKPSPVPSTLGRKEGLLSKSHADIKPVSKRGSRKKGSSREVSKALKVQGASFSNPSVYTSNRRFLLNFSSTMVPRRKRSRLCAPRGTLNKNIKVFGWQEYGFRRHKPLAKADKQVQGGKSASFDSRKSGVWPKQDGNSPEVTVLTESTNGDLVRGSKKEISTKSDCYSLLEQSRKRRKCEPRCIFVLFSHSLVEGTMKQQKKMLKKLGGHVATSAAKATHFVADSFVRSRNMLEIMAAGKVVVTSMWLEGCSQAEYFVDENSYILQDVQKEKQWGFCMHSSLAASRRKPLFKGMKVVVSPTTAPDFDAIKSVIESAGGQALQKPSNSSHSEADEVATISFVVGSEDDLDFCAEFLKKGCKVYSTELILHGVVTQNLDFSRNRLFEDYVQ